MEQRIEIKVSNTDYGPLGIFCISINLNEDVFKGILPENKNTSLKDTFKDKYNNTAEIKLFNVEQVNVCDDITPIQYCTSEDNIANIYLLEAHEYKIQFHKHPECELNLEVFKTLNLYEEVCKWVDPLQGFVFFKSYVGRTFLDISEINLKIPVEVRSRKINYIEDYRRMIGDIANQSAALLFNVNSPLHQSYQQTSKSKDTSYELFMFLIYLFDEDNLPAIFEYLSHNLYSCLKSYKELTPTSLASNIDSNELRDLCSNLQNMYPDENYGIVEFDGKSYIPLEINETKYEDTIDVPENRFYKYFLEFIDYLINDLLNYIKEDDLEDNDITNQLKMFKTQNNYFLSHNYFRDISKMNYLPLNSQVLQKKEGYRDILKYYLMFDLAFDLDWSDLTDDFKGHQKKLSKLYEYWNYFKLVEIFEDYTSSSINLTKIINKKNKWSFNIKEGQETSVTFDTILINDKEIDLTLYYNKTFSGKYINQEDNLRLIITHSKNSYSVQMRPDYTVEINIDNEKHYLHFDAKYKLKFSEAIKSFKNDDIEKMHAYKDAILNSYGAFVLYPGNRSIIYSDDSDYNYFGVGAFPLTPGENKDNKINLTNFIDKFIKDLIKNHSY